MRTIGFRGVAVMMAFAVGPVVGMAANPTTQPFAFLTPTLRLDAADRRNLEGGKAIVKVLPGRGRELSVVAAVRTDAAGERLVAWMRRVGMMQQSRYVPVVARFSSPPRLDDLDGVTLDDDDFVDIRNCQPTDCGLKLSRDEIARLQWHVDRTGRWKQDVEEEFRRALLQRAVDYLADGDFGVRPYEDDSPAVSADVEFASLVDRLGLVSPQLPGVAEYLQLYPRLDHPGVVESFLYWSKETLGFKPITSITHLTLLSSDMPDMPSALAISKQVYANHYKDGAVGLTAIIGSGALKYLVYAHHSHVDVLDGVFGGLVRRIIEQRVRSEAPALLNTLRTRLETGDPP